LCSPLVGSVFETSGLEGSFTGVVGWLVARMVGSTFAVSAGFMLGVFVMEMGTFHRGSNPAAST
jgi:hypothetical protein